MERILGIAEDYYGLQKKWKTLSPFTKMFFVFSLALSSLSIANLADSVYKLKSFMAEAVAFWGGILTTVLEALISVGIVVEKWQLNVITVVILSIVPYLTLRWKQLSKSYRFKIIGMLVINLSIPFYFSPLATINSVLGMYIGTLVLVFWPPVTREFLGVGVGMLLPPLLVAILAAIAEGLSRPIA